LTMASLFSALDNDIRISVKKLWIACF